uniref:Peptidase M13 N-terminal domain-containing protein n=1 Tax=Musca domestica TaxID=7370 RepID=A0A1I8N0D9_MUSDO
MKKLQIVMSVLILLWSVQHIAAESTSQRRLESIQNSIDVNVSVCENFFKYACGKWLVETNTTSSVGHLEALQTKVNGEMEKLLDTNDFSNSPKFLQNIQNYYRACADNSKKEQEVAEYFKWINAEQNIKMPTELWNNETHWEWDYDWIELLALTRRLGFNDLFFFEGITQRIDDSRRMIIEVKRPSLEKMQRLWSVVMQYNISEFKQLFERFSEFNQALFDGLSELYPIQEPYLDSYFDDDSDLITVRDLKMPWLEKYLCVLLNQTDIDPQMQLYIQSVDYLRGVSALLIEYDNSLICDYIHLQFYVYLMEQDVSRLAGSCMP